MSLRPVLFLIFAGCLLSATVAHAGCPNPNASGGESPEGAVVYNAAHKTMQFCDGTAWWAMKNGGGLPSCAAGDGIIMTSAGWGCGGAGGCTAPASCPNVGDVCTDGSLFAGFVVYNNSSCEPLYVTDNNQSTSSQWKNATGTDDISTYDEVDGKVNAANRGGDISNFPAFDLCESNTYHGKSDWYLPARIELDLLWLNRAAIDANAAGNFTTGKYWSSMEYDTDWVLYQEFAYGQVIDDLKTTNNAVRCVRRD